MSRKMTNISLVVSAASFWRLILNLTLSFIVDDSTGVMTCVLWLNDYGNHAGHGNSRSSSIRSWLSDNIVSIGDTLSVLGGLEYY